MVVRSLSRRIVSSAASSASRVLDRASSLGAWLVLPLALLLFAQWPLRDLVGAWSRQANDIAQWLFALYVALALRETTRRHAHLSAGLLVARYPPRWRERLARFGEPLAVLPFALYVLVTSALPTWRSIVGLEAFPDTFNPLYFVIRASAWLLALLMALQALLACAGDEPGAAVASGEAPRDAP
jgi:TRAP-type C4-dicarboxylate transport system permease small subunit